MSYPANTKKNLSKCARLEIDLDRGRKDNPNNPRNSVVTKTKNANEKTKHKLKAPKRFNPSNEDNGKEEDEISGNKSEYSVNLFGGKKFKKKKKID